jgi:uncharacterized protein (TIGR02246 family)
VALRLFFKDTRKHEGTVMKYVGWILTFIVLGIVELLVVETVRAEPHELPTPESVIRQAVLANERRDLEGMAQFFLKDADIASFGIGGLKFVGWTDLERTLRREFQSVARLEIVIHNLKIWTREDVAWFAMELDYTRVLPSPTGETRMKLELRETGVLEKRDGQWLLHSWHESIRQPSTPRLADSSQRLHSATP